MEKYLRKLLFSICFLGITHVFSQAKDVTGVVSDSNGVPLVDVTVSVNNVPKTATDFDGVYSLVVTDGDVITFTYIGFKKSNTKR